jgi:hypothetical protein
MIPGGNRPEDHTSYDVDELRRAAGLDRGNGNDPDKSNKPNYHCQVCTFKKYVDDYQKHTPSWCDHCGEIKTFVRLDDDE